MKKTGPKKVFEFKPLLRPPFAIRSRGVKGLLAGAALGAAAYLAVSSAPSWATVAGTRHNFGSLSTAEVKSQDTSEICVFCHTPHNSSPSSPLWNKADTGATYNVYASQTLAATLSPNAPTLGQPTGSSKLCLTCHDGTVAIGSLLNAPGAGRLDTTLGVTGPGITPAGTIDVTSTSYVGTDLRDDHPISFSYGLSYPSNPEIKAATSFPPEVKLDSASNMQCTSCHDPHGTAFPKFLVATLENGALCNACHDKRYWSTMPSVHSTSTATWNGVDVNPWTEDMGLAGFTDDNPALQSCLACHRSHGGAAGKELLKGTDPVSGLVTDEEWTCLNCHKGTVAAKDVEPAFNYLYKHDVMGTSGAHIPARGLPGDPARETAANLGANRHAECADCHNGHGSMAGNHAVGGINGNIIGPNGLGGWGVRPNPWGTPGTATATYNEVDFTSTTPGGNNLEGYLCLKCHSYYAYGLTPPSVPSGNADGSLVYQSDPTADFNINNMSVHPVFGAGMNTPPVTANPNWPLNSLGLTNTFRYVDFPGFGERTGYYNVQHDGTVACSDCHGSDLSTDPKGVHGSNNKWILKNNETGVGSIRTFCYNCHRRDVYGDESYIGPNANYSRVSHPVDGLGLSSPFYISGANTGNDGNKFGILCLSCHGGSHDATNNVIKGTHGSNAAAGTLAGSDPLGYRMMNGACVESHARATTLSGVQMNFRTVVTTTDTVCNSNFTNFTGSAANYDCNTIASCIN
jgi:predicted CXXCH cytochrome family protein